MDRSRESWKTTIPWSLSTLVSFVALFAWGQSFEWALSAINPYQFFPLLGLLGFSLIWSQYMVAGLQTVLLRGVKLADYFRYTGYAVLLVIVLHPGILIYQRFHDGFGLPPGSYESFVAPGMAWLTLLGTASLLIFLAFELRRWFSRKTWWKFVARAGDLAILAIFYHGLRLGSQLQGGWYHGVWLFYGTTLVLALGHKYWSLLHRRSGAKRITTE